MKMYQKIINKLCEQMEIPRIPVNVMDELDGNKAYYDTELCEMFVEKDITLELLYHEFTHYLIHLLNKAEEIEEEICWRVSESMGEHIKTTYPSVQKLIKGKKKRK